MKKTQTLILICSAAALALPAAGHALELSNAALPRLVLRQPTAIDAEFSALVREVEMASVRAQKINHADPVARSNEEQDLAELRARLERDPAVGKAEKEQAVARERQAIRQRYAALKAQWQAPEPEPELLAALAPVYARYYSIQNMRELAAALNPPFNGKAVKVNFIVANEIAKIRAGMAKARTDAFARKLDAQRPAGLAQ